MLSTLLSILVCAAASLLCACLVSVHFSAPYVIAGSTQQLWAYTCLFRQMARLLLKLSRCLTYADQPACKTIVHALVMYRVDYGNALLFGLPEMQLHKLQMIQNSAARLVTGTHGRDHITPVLFKLHRLPVRYRIEFKLLVLVYQAVHHLGPAYLTSLVTPYAPTRSLRSAAHCSLTIPRYNLERYGRRAFSVAGPSLWNNLPVTIREAGTLTTFKSTLKTHLFRIAFKALC